MGRNKRKKTRDGTDSNESESDSETSSDSDTHTSSKRPHKSSKRRSSGDGSKHRKHKKRSSKTKRHKRDEQEIETISEDDYFKKSSEFRSWLSKERGVYFSDLTSAESHKLFSKFVRKWNSSQLKKKYYDGIHSSSLKHTSQTDYKWKLTGHDEGGMGSIMKDVSAWTSSKGFEEDYREEKGGAEIKVGPTRPQVVLGPQRPPAEFLDPHLMEEKRGEDKKQLQKSRRDFRKHQEMVMDELLPKATGHQARIEKRRAVNQHRKQREVSPDIEESSLLGSSDRIIKDRIKSKQDNRERRAQIATQRISDYKEKEKSKVAAILEMAKANKKEGSLW